MAAHGHTRQGSTATTPIPDQFNVATYFVDRNVAEGRGDNVAIELSGDEQITYRQVLERVNRFGNALQRRARRAHRRARAAAAAGLPRVRLQLLRRHQDRRGAHPHQHAVQARRLRVHPERLAARAWSSISEALLPQLQAIPRERLRYLREVVVVGTRADGHAHASGRCSTASSPELEAEPTSKDDTAFWLYSSGSTGFPKGLRAPAPRHGRLHRPVRAAASWASRERDRCFSVAKLFFAYGLGNGLYFPFARRRHDDAVRGSAHAGQRVRDRRQRIGRRCSSRCRPTTPSCWRNDADARLFVRPLGRFGRRSAAAGDLRALSRSASG